MCSCEVKTSLVCTKVEGEKTQLTKSITSKKQKRPKNSPKSLASKQKLSLRSLSSALVKFLHVMLSIYMFWKDYNGTSRLIYI